MRDFVKWFVIIVFVAAIVFSFSACRKDSLDGTSWMANFMGAKLIIRFNSPNFTMSAGGHMLIEGSYSISDVIVFMAETVSSESIDNGVFTGTLSGNILAVILGHETINFTKRHRIFN